MQPVVRAATQRDIDAVVDLNVVVQTLHSTLYPDHFKGVPEPSAARVFFAAKITATTDAIGVVEFDGVVVGYVWFGVQNLPETPFTPGRRRMYVYQIAVAPGVRRRGVATALMDYVERWTADDGVDEIALDTWSSNVDAKKFFRSRKFEPLTVNFWKSPKTALDLGRPELDSVRLATHGPTPPPRTEG